MKRRGTASRKTVKTGRRRTTKVKRDEHADTGAPIPARGGHSLVDLQEKLKRQAHELEEAREEREALAEVLRVISSSPGELEPVFNAMLENAVRICGAKFGNLWILEGDAFRIGATYGAPSPYVEFLMKERIFRPDPRYGLGQLVRTKKLYHIADMTTLANRTKLVEETIHLAGARTLIALPMLKNNEVMERLSFTANKCSHSPTNRSS